MTKNKVKGPLSQKTSGWSFFVPRMPEISRLIVSACIMQGLK